MKNKYEAPKVAPTAKEDLQIEADYIIVGPIRIQLHTENGILESTLPNLLVKNAKAYKKNG